MVLCDWDFAPFWVVSPSLTQMLFEKKLLSSISLAMIQRRGGQKNDEQVNGAEPD